MKTMRSEYGKAPKCTTHKSNFSTHLGEVLKKEHWKRKEPPAQLVEERGGVYFNLCTGHCTIPFLQGRLPG